MHESSQWCRIDIPGTQIWHSLFLFRPSCQIEGDKWSTHCRHFGKSSKPIIHSARPCRGHPQTSQQNRTATEKGVLDSYRSDRANPSQAHCFPRSSGSSISHPMQRSYASSLYSRRGKTALAAAVVQSKDVQDKSKLRFWVPCIQATSTALFLELLYTVQIPTNQSIKWKCSWRRCLWAERVKRPSTCPTRQFWNTSEQMRCEIGDILPELAKIAHTALFVTMRGKRPLCHEYIAWTNHELGPVDENASRRIYHQLNPRSTKPVISRVPSRGMVATWH